MPIPIAEYPSYISEMCGDFEYLFQQERQFLQFKRLMTSFVLPEKHTIANMNGFFIDHTDQSNLNRFVTHSSWDALKVNQKKIEMINSVEDDGIVVLDDYIIEKTGKKIHGVDWHFDHAKKRSLFGHQIADCVFSGKGIYSLLSQIYLRKGGKWLKDLKFKTKIDLQKENLTQLNEMGLKFSVVVMDIWYFNKKLTDHILLLGKDWVAQCKSNRLVKSQKKWISLKSYAEDAIGTYAFKNITLGDKTYLMKAFTIQMKGMGKVKLLISLNEYKNFNFYVTNQLHWNELAIATRYSRRWDVEVWHREGKVSFGLKDCQLRSDEAVKKYMTLSALAATLLEIATMLSPVYAMLFKRVRTPGLKHRWIIAEMVGQLISYASNIGTMGTRKIVDSILFPYKSTIWRYAG